MTKAINVWHAGLYAVNGTKVKDLPSDVTPEQIEEALGAPGELALATPWIIFRREDAHPGMGENVKATKIMGRPVYGPVVCARSERLPLTFGSDYMN